MEHGIRGHELERILKYKFGKDPAFALPDCTLEKLQNQELKTMIEARIKTRPRAPRDANDFSVMLTEDGFDGFICVK